MRFNSIWSCFVNLRRLKCFPASQKPQLDRLHVGTVLKNFRAKSRLHKTTNVLHEITFFQSLWFWFNLCKQCNVHRFPISPFSRNFDVEKAFLAVNTSAERRLMVKPSCSMDELKNKPHHTISSREYLDNYFRWASIEQEIRVNLRWKNLFISKTLSCTNCGIWFVFYHWFSRKRLKLNCDNLELDSRVKHVDLLNFRRDAITKILNKRKHKGTLQ